MYSIIFLVRKGAGSNPASVIFCLFFAGFFNPKHKDLFFGHFFEFLNKWESREKPPTKEGTSDTEPPAAAQSEKIKMLPSICTLQRARARQRRRRTQERASLPIPLPAPPLPGAGTRRQTS